MRQKLESKVVGVEGGGEVELVMSVKVGVRRLLFSPQGLFDRGRVPGNCFNWVKARRVGVVGSTSN